MSEAMKIRVKDNERFSYAGKLHLDGMVFEVKDIYDEHYVVPYYDNKLLMVPFENAEVIKDGLSETTKLKIVGIESCPNNTAISATIQTDKGRIDGEFKLNSSRKIRSWGDAQEIVYEILRSL